MSNFFPNNVCFRIYRCFIWQLYNFYLYLILYIYNLYLFYKYFKIITLEIFLSNRKIKYNQAQDNLYLFLKTIKYNYLTILNNKQVFVDLIVVDLIVSHTYEYSYFSLNFCIVAYYEF